MVYISAVRISDMRVPPGCVISARVQRTLQNPDLFARYVLGRAVTAGFAVTPARVEDVARALKASASSDLTPDEAYVYYRDIFRAFLAQDPSLSRSFDKFWDELWYYCPVQEGYTGTTISQRIGQSIAQKVARTLSGQVRIPVEVLLK